MRLVANVIWYAVLPLASCSMKTRMIPVATRLPHHAIDAHIGPNCFYKKSISHIRSSRSKIKHVPIYSRSLSHAFASCSNTKVTAFEALELCVGKNDSPHGGYHLQGRGSIEPTGSTSMMFENYLEDSIQREILIHGGRKGGSSKKKRLKEFDEMERRRKISEANKGKIPWNKGRHHSIETRELIKKRTLEALRDPKVRKKMVECPRAHSEQSKARIGFALRKAWERRLKRKFVQDKCCAQWREHIAEAARNGGIEQKELDWDSYDKLKLEIAQRELQEKAQKEKVKEITKQQRAKNRAEKKVLMAEENFFRKAQKAKAKAKAKAESGQKAQKETETKGSLVSKELLVMAKLPKVKKSSVSTSENDSGAPGIQPVVEKWDLEFVKRENMRRTVSLADQLRALRFQKAQSAASETNSSNHDEKSEI